MYRFLRCFLCLLVVCCLIINLSPIKADATAAGAAIAGASAVAAPAALVVGAGLIALGIMAGTNDDFQRVVGNAVDSLGDWVKDGTVELIQTVDTLGKKAYYVAGALIDDLNQWVYSADVVSSMMNTSVSTSDGSYTWTSSIPFAGVSYINSSNGVYYFGVFTREPGVVDLINSDGSVGLTISLAANSYGCPYNGYYFFVTGGLSYIPDHFKCFTYIGEFSQEQLNSHPYNYRGQDGRFIAAEVPLNFTTILNVSLGSLASSSTSFIDGTSARQWSEEYTNRGLYVVEGSGGSSTPPEDDPGDDGNDNNGKWYWPLVLGAAAFGAGAGIGALTQQDQWTGETPQEFDDYTPTTNYEVLPAPDVEFGSSVILNPVVVPDQGGDDGDDPGSVPDDGEDPSVTPDGGKDYSNWFAKIVGFLENIWNSILELPSKFATWFDNIISEIQELPSKFATWFENIISAIQELPSKFAEWFGNLISCLERIWESICNIPEALGNVLRSIFVPSEDFLTEKVQDLRNRFNWIEPILGYGNYIKAQFIDPVPPVVYVHLGDAEGSYNYGGTVKFLDMSWYERYKSQGDAIISGFLWALFAWRMYVKLPGIINGVAGDVGHISYGESAWQKAEARKERKEKGGKNK